MLGLPSVPSEPVELPVPPALASAAIPPAPALAAAVPRGRSVQAPVRMLHLEDSEPDHALVLAQLRRSGLPVAVQRVETRADFTLALAERWDVIVSDFHLPGFTGVQALQLLKEHVAQGGRAVPFILVSGQIGEDVAVEAMRNGAADYLLKNNLARLAPAIEHAIEAAEEQRARRAADAELQVSRARLSALAQHLQTSVEGEGGGREWEGNKRRGRLAHGVEVRTRLDTPTRWQRSPASPR
jgi:CheY-like chemotaxis protein